LTVINISNAIFALNALIGCSLSTSTKSCSKIWWPQDWNYISKMCSV